ncbi:MAG: DUF192 domain-containing protein [Dehalococcoidia bacterium]
MLLPSASAQTSVALQAGWNNVAYQGTTLSVEQALGNAGSTVSAVWHWEADTASWRNYFPAVPSISTLPVLETGEAYWIFAAEPVTWVQPAGISFESARVEVTTQASDTRALHVELADTPERRSRGLMFRQSLAEDVGMLFLFPSDTTGGFWMQDTFVPLSIAFIDAAGSIVDIQDMEPLTTTLHSPAVPYRWALEVRQGWFSDNGVGLGDVVRLTGE